MQTYKHYKDSGIDWIGQIPEHWEIRRFKYLFNEINERSIDGNEDLLSVSQYTGVTKKSDKIDDGDLLTNASTLEGYKKVRKHQLVSNIMLAWNGSLAFSEYNGITSPAYCIYELKHDDVYKYFHYLFKTDLYKSEFKRNSSGVIESRLRLYTDDFFSIWSVLPPIHEQEAIANFLDDKTAKIDALVQTKEQQIEKLKELRQAKIHQAVTKGLDANAPTKDSGVEWIGEIPAHWEVKKFRYTINLRHGYQFRDNDFTEEGIKIVKITQLNKDGFLDLTKADTISYSRVNSFKEIIIKNNDILMCLTGGTIGKIILVKDLDEVVLQNYRVGHFSSINDQLSNKLLFYILSADYFQKQINNDLSETGQPNIGMEDLKKMDVVIPRYFEQADIVAYLDEVTGKIDQAIAQKQEQITKLKEYKQSLINDVVTGKVKVC